MPVGDSRKAHLLSTIASHFSIPSGGGSIESLHDNNALNSFLDDGNITALSANHKDNVISLSNKVRRWYLFTAKA